MSLVEVSLSIVMQLNVVAHVLASSACNAGWAMAASVKMKHSIVAMSGAIMPAPLQKPLIDDRHAAELSRAGRELGIGVGGHDRARRRLRRRPARPTARARRADARTCSASSGSPITPVEATIDLVGGAADGLGGGLRRDARGLAALLAREGVGVAGVDHQRARLAVPSGSSRHHSTGAEQVLERVSTPAAAVPGSNTAIIRSVRLW